MHVPISQAMLSYFHVERNLSELLKGLFLLLLLMEFIIECWTLFQTWLHSLVFDKEFWITLISIVNDELSVTVLR